MTIIQEQDKSLIPYIPTYSQINLTNHFGHLKSTYMEYSYLNFYDETIQFLNWRIQEIDLDDLEEKIEKKIEIGFKKQQKKIKRIPNLMKLVKKIVKELTTNQDYIHIKQIGTKNYLWNPSYQKKFDNMDFKSHIHRNDVYQQINKNQVQQNQS